MRKIRVFQEDAYLSLDYGAQTGENIQIILRKFHAVIAEIIRAAVVFVTTENAIFF